MKTILTLILFIFLGTNCLAQESECKDDIITITIYSKLKVAGMGCGSCFDSLAARIERTPYAFRVKRYYEQASITFSMPSNKALNKKQVQGMVQSAGLILIELEFSKVDFEVQPDVDKVF
jgi:hypothetical protein